MSRHQPRRPDASNSGISTAPLGLSADEVLTTTRAVRKRLDLRRPVPRSVLHDCVEIAMQAPSGRNRQQWDFVFVTDPDRRAAVSDIWRRGLRAQFDGGTESRMSFNSLQWQQISDSLRYLDDHFHQVPVLLIPCLRVRSRDALTTVRGQAGNWGSVIPAVWSFMLAARSRGLGTAWTTCHLSYEREMAQVLSIPFETVVQAALTPVAYTIGTSFRPGPRAPRDDFLHWQAW